MGEFWFGKQVTDGSDSGANELNYHAYSTGGKTGRLKRMGFYVYDASGHKVTGAIFSGTTTKIAESPEWVVPGGGYQQTELEFASADRKIIEAGTYNLAIMMEDGRILYDASPSANLRWYARTYSLGMPSTLAAGAKINAFLTIWVVCDEIFESSAELYCAFEIGGSANLLAKFKVRQDSAELLARFEVGQGSESLYAQFEVGQDSVEILSNAIIRQSGSAELLVRFEGRGLDSAELLGKGIIRQSGSAELLGIAVIRQPGSAELLGKFEAQATAELLIRVEVKGLASVELLGNAVIRQSGSAELLGNAEVQQSGSSELLGNAVIRHSGSAELLGKADIKQSGSAELLGNAVIRQSGSAELLGKAVIRHVGAPAELLGEFEAQATAELLGNVEVQQSGSAELLGKAAIRQPDSAELLGNVEVQQSGSAELLGRAEIRQSGSAELLGNVEVQQSGSAELLGKTVIRQSGSAELLGNAEVQQSGSSELLGKFEAQAIVELPAVFWVRQPFRLWTNRRYVNGVVELTETLIGNAIFEYVIEGVMQDIQSYLINAGLDYLAWTDIVITPVLIRRATTYGTVAALYSRRARTFASRVIPTIAPVTLTAIGDEERALNHWLGKMNKALELYVSSQGGEAMLTSTPDEEPVFTTEDIPPELSDFTPWYLWLMRREQ